MKFVRIAGTALLLGAALTTSAFAGCGHHGSPSTPSLINLNAGLLNSTPAKVTASLGNVAGAAINVGGNSLANITAAVPGVLGAKAAVGSTDNGHGNNNGSLANITAVVPGLLGAKATVGGSNVADVKANVGNLLGAKVDVGGLNGGVGNHGGW